MFFTRPSELIELDGLADQPTNTQQQTADEVSQSRLVERSHKEPLSSTSGRARALECELEVFPRCRSSTNAVAACPSNDAWQPNRHQGWIVSTCSTVHYVKHHYVGSTQVFAESQVENY